MSVLGLWKEQPIFRTSKDSAFPNATLNSDITPEYLRLRGVEATRAFADSPNAKTIIMGGRDGLPVILNTGDDDRAAASSSNGARPK